jgi:tetratricopeptide (TPR) repeat protein
MSIATYGLVLIPAAIGVGAWVWYRRRQPDSIAQRILKQAQLAQPVDAVGLFNQALEVDPHGLKTLSAAASWFSQNQCYQDAAEAYAGILHLGSALYADLSAERKYVACLLGAGRVDEAIPRLEHMRALSTAGDSLEVAVLAELATAYLQKGQTSQAMAFIDLAPLQKRNLDTPLQLCLYLRGVGRYLDGDHRRAIADLERLYAVNPTFPDLIASKAAMESGTFVFESARPYPSWYPIEHREEVLASESEGGGDDPKMAALTSASLPPDSAEDAEAQVAQIDSDLITPPVPSPTISPDGAWRWDGTRWTPNVQRSEV